MTSEIIIDFDNIDEMEEKDEDDDLDSEMFEEKDEEDDLENEMFEEKESEPLQSRPIGDSKPVKTVYIRFLATGFDCNNSDYTSDPWAKFNENDPPNDNNTIYISGAMFKNVGVRNDIGLLGAIDPDLKICASKFNSAFNKDGSINVKKLKKAFGTSARVPPGMGNVKPDECYFDGFSRGCTALIESVNMMSEEGKRGKENTTKYHVVLKEPTSGNSGLGRHVGSGPPTFPAQSDLWQFVLMYRSGALNSWDHSMPFFKQDTEYLREQRSDVTCLSFEATSHGDYLTWQPGGSNITLRDGKKYHGKLVYKPMKKIYSEHDLFAGKEHETLEGVLSVLWGVISPTMAMVQASESKVGIAASTFACMVCTCATVLAASPILFTAVMNDRKGFSNTRDIIPICQALRSEYNRLDDNDNRKYSKDSPGDFANVFLTNVTLSQLRNLEKRINKLDPDKYKGERKELVSWCQDELMKEIESAIKVKGYTPRSETQAENQAKGNQHSKCKTPVRETVYKRASGAKNVLGSCFGGGLNQR